MNEELKALLPHIRHVGFDLEMVPYARLIVPKEWTTNFDGSKFKTTNVNTYNKAYEFDVQMNSSEGNIDELIEAIGKEIQTNKEKVLKEELIQKRILEFQAKLASSDLNDLQSLDINQVFKTADKVLENKKIKKNNDTKEST